MQRCFSAGHSVLIGPVGFLGGVSRAGFGSI